MHCTIPHDMRYIESENGEAEGRVQETEACAEEERRSYCIMGTGLLRKSVGIDSVVMYLQQCECTPLPLKSIFKKGCQACGSCL